MTPVKRVSLYSRSRPKVAGSVPAVKKAEVESRVFKGSLRRHRATIVAALPGILALIFVAAQ